MNKAYKKGFTLAEIIICMVVLGFIAMLLATNVNMSDFNKKANIANAMKIVRIFNEASIKIKGQEINCPTGNFIESIPGNKNNKTYELTFLKDGKAPVDAASLVDIYSEHLRFEKKLQIDDRPGAKISGTNVYIAFEVYDKVKQCPDYIDIETKESISTSDNSLCWGNLYIYTNGIKKTNIDNNNAYIFGLDKDGVNLQGTSIN